MTNEQILKKAIEKAYPSINGVCQCDELLNSLEDLLEFDHAGGFNYYCLIFSHDFAKALWGEKKPLWDGDGVGERICLHCGVDTAYQPPRISGCCHVHYPEGCEICSNKEKDWHYHLQQMVLEKEPLKYLEGFLERGEKC